MSPAAAGSPPAVRRPGAASSHRAGPFVLLWVCVAVLAGCASAAPRPESEARLTRTAISSYLQQVEPIRLAVNRVLNTADPILRTEHDGRATPAQTARRMGRLEQRFAGYAVDIAAIEPATAQLRTLHTAYAHTYVLEDAYLSALVAGLADGDLDDLPDTQDAQRAAIIAWRTGLTVLARQSGAALPADLQQAGRGEVVPSPDGS